MYDTLFETTLPFFTVRLIKRPRGTPGPRKQLSVRCELSVREVIPDRRPSEPIHKKRPFPEFSRSPLIAIRCDESLLKMIGKITKKKNKNLSVRCELSVREVPRTPKTIKRPFRIKRPRGAPRPQKQLSVRGR